MYTALRATAKTLVEHLKQSFIADPHLGPSFNGGTMVVSLNTPQEMADQIQGVSVWLYRVVRDEQRVNMPPERLGMKQLQRPPLPIRLHFLITPIVNGTGSSSRETELDLLGKVLQVLHDHPILQGVDLQDDLSGTTVELHVRLESLNLEEITRIYNALERPYQLSVSYEVSDVYISSVHEPENVAPVLAVMPEYGIITSS